MAKMLRAKVEVNHIPKRTSIGRGNVKTASMNKHKKSNYKKYRGQG